MSRQNTELSATTAVPGQSSTAFGVDPVAAIPNGALGQATEMQTTDDGFTIMILNCKRDDEIMIGDDVRLRVLTLRGHRVRLGIEAPTQIPIARGELVSGELRQPEALAARGKSAAGNGPSSGEDLLMDLP
jgi:carbon storage regulator